MNAATLGPSDAPTLRRRLPAARGFTLIEILVAMALLSFIVIGLVTMFGQTQRAFVQSLTDVDLLENGRAVMDMLVRDLAEAAPADVSNAANFYVEIPQQGENIHTQPLLQALPGTSSTPQLRTNYLQPFFFLSHPNQMWPDKAWAGIGYYVVPDVSGVGIGTLYRYAGTNATPPAQPSAALPPPTPDYLLPPTCFMQTHYPNSFANALVNLRTDTSLVPWAAPVSMVTRVADGVIHLSVRLFATNGFPIMSDLNPLLYNYTAFWAGYWTNVNNVTTYLEYAQPILQASNHINLTCPDYYDSCWFMSNAMPASVEVELGILESQTYQRYRAIVSANPAAGAAFLSNHVAQVHIFRQRVPIHNVDPSAY
ncbi:MAG: PilW family protein [Limisphaerales bacterium]